MYLEVVFNGRVLCRNTGNLDNFVNESRRKKNQREEKTTKTTDIALFVNI